MVGGRGIKMIHTPGRGHGHGHGVHEGEMARAVAMCLRKTITETEEMGGMGIKSGEEDEDGAQVVRSGCDVPRRLSWMMRRYSTKSMLAE
jgi:hypothetical protein